MKIYHKFFLYQNKLLQPYVRLLLRLMAIITYLASIMLIVGVIYEHGFTLSAHEVTKIHLLYKTVWIIFLIDVTLHILLEYRDTKKNFRKLAWILSWLLYLTLIPVIFHRPHRLSPSFIISLLCFHLTIKRLAYQAGRCKLFSIDLSILPILI